MRVVDRRGENLVVTLLGEMAWKEVVEVWEDALVRLMEQGREGRRRGGIAGGGRGWWVCGKRKRRKRQ